VLVRIEDPAFATPTSTPRMATAAADPPFTPGHEGVVESAAA
jgi:hypothetical protein